MTVYVDHATLDTIAQSFSGASSELDGVAASAPESIDGGDATAAVLGILSRLMHDAGQLVAGLDAAGQAVADANAKYREQDVETADALIEAWSDPE